MRPAWRTGFLAAACFLVIMVPLAALPAEESLRWTFDHDAVGEPPAGWEIRSGEWQVRPDNGDGQNRVLVQTGPPLPGVGLPAILAPSGPRRDLQASVEFKPLGQGALESMGMLFRWRGPNETSIIRVDATSGRVWLDRIRGGQRSLQAGYVIPIRPGVWSVLAISARKDWLDLFLNGRLLGRIREDDPISGRVGLMAGPDAGVLLDDLEIKAPELSVSAR